MSWSSEVQHVLDTGSPSGVASTPFIELAEGETAHVQVQRTDAGATDRWRVRALASTDKARADTIPFQQYVLQNGDNVKSFLVYGPYSFLVRLDNAELSKTDTIAATVYYRKNGVAI